ncbi:MAG TPA: hypothetical protein PK322_04115 [Opitutaceae bacterium]|nr:hypothetical protein [Opitutaceae bacterium]
MRILRVLFPLVLLATFAFWSGGCSTTVQKAGVAVSLLDVTVGADNRAVLLLRMQNENIVPLALASTKQKVFLNGVAYGEAIGEKPVALTEHGDVRHEAVLTLADAAAAERLRAALAAGAVDYRLECRLLCDLGEEDLILITTVSGRLERR